MFKLRRHTSSLARRSHMPPLKVLCLHGFMQNGSMFRARTGSFRKVRDAAARKAQLRDSADVCRPSRTASLCSPMRRILPLKLSSNQRPVLTFHAQVAALPPPPLPHPPTLPSPLCTGSSDVAQQMRPARRWLGTAGVPAERPALASQAWTNRCGSSPRRVTEVCKPPCE